MTPILLLMMSGGTTAPQPPLVPAYRVMVNAAGEVLVNAAGQALVMIVYE